MKQPLLLKVERPIKTITKRLCTGLQQRATANRATVISHHFSALFNFFERLETWQALRSGPPWIPSLERLIIDITLECNLGCIDCNRSVGKEQAWTKDQMTVEQIQRFIEESVAKKKKWSEIAIEGGEPTLHPQLLDIIEMLLAYKRNHAPWTNIKLQTNGYGKNAARDIETLCKAGVNVYNSEKESLNQSHHCSFNMAPKDDSLLSGNDFTQGCHLPTQYGLGLTPYGFYPHPVCGSIDRVFGFNIGRKTIPNPNDTMKDHFETLCPYCGFFPFCRQMQKKQIKLANQGQRSPSWQQAYKDYHNNTPPLDRY